MKDKITCEYCGKKAEKERSEINRSKKIGRPLFCSRSCSVAAGNTKTPRGDSSNLRKGSCQDDFSSFRWYLARVKTRVKEKGKTNDLTLEYLKKLWEDQKGICPFTGWQMELPLGTVRWSSSKNPKRASLDRIDCSKGYTQANVRFVSVIANYARNNFDDKDVIEFCKAVTEKQNDTRPLENATRKQGL